MWGSPGVRRLLRRALALLLLASTLGSLVAPLPATAAPRGGALAAIAGPGDLPGLHLLADLLQWLGRAVNPGAPAASSAGASGEGGPRARFGFSESNRVAQMTGTATLGTSTPTETVSLTPPAGSETPAGTVSPTASPGTPTPTATPLLTGTPILPPAPPVYPSEGRLVLGQAGPSGGQASAFGGARLGGGARLAADGPDCSGVVQLVINPTGQVNVTGRGGTAITQLTFSAANFQNAYVGLADATISRESLPDGASLTYFLTPPMTTLTM
jgi:hypothetical protein